jgi:hypothetical protein
MREPRRLTNLQASTACYRDTFTFLLVFVVIIRLSNSSSGDNPLAIYIASIPGFTPSILSVLHERKCLPPFQLHSLNRYEHAGIQRLCNTNVFSIDMKTKIINWERVHAGLAQRAY